MRSSIVILFLAFFTNLDGQALKGRVLDKSDNTPIADVQIKLIGKSASTKTNADGMIGKHSVVNADVSPNEHFYAKIDGVAWDCLCSNSLLKGDKVRVVSLESTVLITEKIDLN